MRGAGGFRADVRVLLRRRILDAARDLTAAQGWSTLTMGAVASRAGISRQHLYSEIGTKQDLGDAMLDRETDEFLSMTCAELRAHPTDLVEGVGAAVRRALEHGADNRLLKAILSGDGTRGESLLPLLTARPEAVLARAGEALRAEVASLHPTLAEEADLAVCIEGVARLVLSHLTQPTGPLDRAVRQAQWLTRSFVQGL